MAFDHAQHVAAALAKLRDKVERHALPLHLLPPKFTLTQLQRTVEAILGREVEKSALDLPDADGGGLHACSRDAMIVTTSYRLLVIRPPVSRSRQAVGSGWTRRRRRPEPAESTDGSRGQG
ncbi:MAG: hypothetical protein M5U30_21750 [Burkholderiaceae bacterium]|nr:hypothetical protein [Burkholderiaceae bacterium]